MSILSSETTIRGGAWWKIAMAASIRNTNVRVLPPLAFVAYGQVGRDEPNQFLLNDKLAPP